MEEGFHKFLKRGGRSESAVRRALSYMSEFERYLEEHRAAGLNEAESEDLEAFVAWVEQKTKASARGYLWGIGYYYDYIANEEMSCLASILREQRIERHPFLLREFLRINPKLVEKLAAVGIRNIQQMLEAGTTRRGRIALAKETGVSEDQILELVKLSDLARIPGVKGIRARLYYDAGVDTLEKMAEWEPEELREMVAEYVERTGFEGKAPLPAEVRFTIAQASRLPKRVEY